MTSHSLSDASSTFEWDEYLHRTSGHPADPKCFRQSLVPPPNYFEVNSLLEAEDQRSAAQYFQTSPLSSSEAGRSRTTGLGTAVVSGNRSSTLLASPVSSAVRRFRAAAFTLAQVIEVCGSRIRIRLVGTDDRNDCWFLVDSDQIRAYPSGEPLQPPFGYMHNHLHWSRTLKSATEGAKFAEPSCFITPPSGPADNLFRIGDKLEAVDRRNTQLICPATISAVNGQHILVSFDGWSDFDYWTRFDSRELFPVGWCKMSGYPLQPPGPHALRSPPIHSTPSIPTQPRKLTQSANASHPTPKLSRSFTSKTPLKRSSSAITRLGLKKTRSNALVNRRSQKGSKRVTSGSDRSGLFDRLTKPLNVVTSDSLGDANPSTCSSTKSLSSPPVIHAMNEDSSLNVSLSSSDHPPTIEAAIPLPSEGTRVRKTSSSSDCVVRLHLKTSPSVNAITNAKTSNKSWEVVRTKSPNDKGGRFKVTKKHNNALNKIKRAKKTTRASDVPASDKNAPVKVTPSNSINERRPLSPKCNSNKEQQPAAVPGPQSVNATPVTTGPRHVETSVQPAQHPLHLYCDDLRRSSASNLPYFCHNNLIYPTARPHSISPMEPADDEMSAATARMVSGRFWFPPFKGEMMGSKLMENGLTSQSTEDYLDGQSLAPQISSSTVSPSSLDLGPGSMPNPVYWTIDEVSQYITNRDSSLSEVAETFKHHEIDGQALLLLNMESLRNYLKIKLGPALKVDHLISRLKRGIL